jgi:hypothetical protein
MLPIPHVVGLVFTLFSRWLLGCLGQQEFFVYLKKFLVGDWSSLQEES